MTKVLVEWDISAADKAQSLTPPAEEQEVPDDVYAQGYDAQAYYFGSWGWEDVVAEWLTKKYGWFVVDWKLAK